MESRIPPDATVDLTEADRLHYAGEAERLAAECTTMAQSLRGGYNPTVMEVVALGRAGRFIDDLLQQWILTQPQ